MIETIFDLQQFKLHRRRKKKKNETKIYLDFIFNSLLVNRPELQFVSP